MENKGKKYVIRESELNEIIKEMILMEVYNPADYRDIYTRDYNPNKHVNAGDILQKGWDLITKAPSALVKDKWKEAAANNVDPNKPGSGFWQWILGGLDATKEGTAGPDYIPDWWNPGWSGGQGKGQNKDAHEVFNVQAAVNYLRRYAAPSYGALTNRQKKRCAEYVRTALNAGGLKAPWGMYGGNAYNYMQILPNNGWYYLNDISQVGQPGDVCVIDAHKGHPYGHISMCLGGGVWASNFIQKDMCGLRTPPPPAVVKIFRYANRLGMDNPPNRR